MNHRLSCLLITLLALLSTTAAWAGMDDIQNITHITGAAEVRGNIKRGGKHLKFAHWGPAKAGDVLGPSCSVRTGAQSTVRLTTGDGQNHPRKGDRVSYTILQPRTLILLHSQYQSRKKLIEVIRGRIVREEKLI